MAKARDFWLPRLDSEQVREFSQQHLDSAAMVRSDALSVLKVIAERCQHEARITAAESVNEWLPMVHIVIANLKRFLLGTFHGVSGKYLQEYLDEFVYRFNRRMWQSQLPNCLLQASVSHASVSFRLKQV